MKRLIVFALLPVLPIVASAQTETPPVYGLHTQSNQPATPPPYRSPSNVGAPHTCLRYYPAHLVAAGVEGTTELAYRITVEGAVTGVTVTKSSGNTELDQVAVRCASAWRYTPALENGKPTEVPWAWQVKWVLPH